MFSVSRPSSQEIQRFLRESESRPLSYEPVGLALNAGPSFDSDQQTIVLGSGQAILERAKLALSQWTQFRLGWVDLFPQRASIAPGSVVAVLIRHVGLYSLNGCRVVYSVGEDDPNEFGFAYGTLTNHAEAGEELFRVAIHPGSGEVTYTIRAASKPRAPLARLGYPVARVLQARFRSDSARTMKRAVAD